MSKIISLIAVLALCAGCAPLTPALAGKTTYSQTFEDSEAGTVVDGVAVPGQSTKYTLNIKAPAGVKLDDITGMTYTWDPEKGQITINKSGTTDSTAQLQGIIEVNKDTIGLANNALSLAAPIVGTKIQGDQTNDAAQIQSDAVFRANLIAALKELGVLKLSKPATPPADSPGADLPEVGTN